MTEFTPISATVGGILIGLSAVWLMATLGRVAGISGIVGGMNARDRGEAGWRLAFLLGLVGTPAVAIILSPGLAVSDFSVGLPVVVIGAILVGVGTTLGSGCTSGHGVCGNARLSMRSLVATLTFMAAGAATVFVVRHIAGGGA